MTTYLSLTPTQGPTQTLKIPSEETIVVDLPSDSSHGTGKLSFTRTPETPPATRTNDHIPQSRARLDTSQADLPQSTTQAKAASSTNGNISQTNGYQDHVATAPTTTYSSLNTSLSPATRFKHRLRNTNELVVCPGVYDGLSARVAMAVGFPTMYMVCCSFGELSKVSTLTLESTGAGSTASKLGMADLGIASRNDMVSNADMIANLNPHHHELIADMDTGYGGMLSYVLGRLKC